MKLHVDLETLQLIENPGFRNPVTALRFKRGDAAQLEVRFLAGGTTPIAIGDPGDLEIRFGIKPRNRYDVGYLVHSADWTMPAPDADPPVYQCSPSFNTVELNSALGVGSATGTELAEITLMGEITWRLGSAEPTSTRTFLVVVENDVNRGTEGVPVSAEPIYPAPVSIELLTHKGMPDGYAPLDDNGQIPSSHLPPLHGIQVTSHGVAVGKDIILHGAATLLGALAGGAGVSVGAGAASHGNAIAIGANALAFDHGIAIGFNARTEGGNCIAIGNGVVTGDTTTGFGRLEIAPIGSTGPRLSAHVWGGTNVMQLSVSDGHGFTPIASHGGAVFNHATGTLPPGMMMFAYSSQTSQLLIYVNNAGTLKTATIPMT